MCGIAGVLTVDTGDASLPARVGAMQRALAHRGPDDRGWWSSAGGHATLAHTRLAIIDPTPAGHQPMSVDRGRLTIVLNGQIYNFKELRRELEGRGVAFHTNSDAEVVLHAYDAYGDACVARLRGMFAFAIWDERARRCLLARDRCGIKPLYYEQNAGRLVFASELRALTASGLVSTAIDGSAVYEYFRAGSVPEPRTLLAATRVLEAGHLATWTQGRLQIRKYWDVCFNAELRPEEAVAATRAALLDAVQHHLVGDVPVGLFLSGGVDSSAILALARLAGRVDVRVVTMSLPGSEADELPLARRTAEHFGVPLDVCSVDAKVGKGLFADYLAAMDQPSIDGINTLAVSRAAQAAGLKVMLSGVGADELFGGYPSVRAVPRFAAWDARLAAIGPLRRATGRLLERGGDARWARVGDMLGHEPSLVSAYAMYRGIFTRAEARRLADREAGDVAPDIARDGGSAADPNPQDAVTRLELTRYLRNQLLRDTDVMSMACGVEIRLPYLDTRVVDTLTRIGPQTRLDPAKSLLLKAVPEIPTWIARQPKRGFMLPIDSWLQREWRGTLDLRMDACPVVATTWYRRWCLTAFEHWRRRLREQPPEPSNPIVVGQVAHG